jgi:hypothetical protein
VESFAVTDEKTSEMSMCAWVWIYAQVQKFTNFSGILFHQSFRSNPMKMPLHSKKTIGLPSTPSLESLHYRFPPPVARTRSSSSSINTREAHPHALEVASLLEEALVISKDFHLPSQSKPNSML